jgi:hypothetical protein
VPMALGCGPVGEPVVSWGLVSWIGEVDVGDLVEVGAPHRTAPAPSKSCTFKLRTQRYGCHGGGAIIYGDGTACSIKRPHCTCVSTTSAFI